MGIGIVFPGQASQFPGMGKELYDAYPAARAVFDEASEALGDDLAALCFSATGETLTLTANAQPAIFTVSVAAFRVLSQETGLSVRCAAGHSLGEYSALVAAGAIPLGPAVKVLRARGTYMQDAVPPGQGAMAAIIGLSADAVAGICRAASSEGVVEPANFNGGDQIVISGAARAVQGACDAAKAAGAKRALPLPVSAPFHCALMEPAAVRLAPQLRAMKPGGFRFPVVANVTAQPYPDGESPAELLIRQIVAPVRWEECVGTMRALGATTFVEVGPGKVLSGLVRRIDREVAVGAFGAPADLAAVGALLR